MTEASSSVLFFTSQEVHFHRYIKNYVFKVWLQQHVILCLPWRAPPFG